jgi:hypothetical protein
MSSHSDNAVDNAELDMRGEKGTRGPRAKFIVVAALLNKKIIMDSVPADDEESASIAFLNKHDGVDVKSLTFEYGQNCKEIGGGQGFYLAKGTGASEAARQSVTVPASQFRPTPTSVRAEYRGWIVYGNGIRAFSVNGPNGPVSYEDDELFSILFDQLADKNNKVPKPKLKKNEAVRAEELKILKSHAAT